MPGYGPLPRYRGPFFRDDDRDMQREPDADADEGLPPVMPGMQFMPASPEQRAPYDPNVGDPEAYDQWLLENVFNKGLSVDGATGDIIDPDTGEIRGKVPQFYPRT